MSQPIRGQGGHLVLQIDLKNTNLVEDIEILLPVKIRCIPFVGFRGEVENVSANQRPGRPSCFFDRSEKHKLCRGRSDLASCQISLTYMPYFSGAILGFSWIFSGTNDIFLGQILQNSGTLSGTF